MESVTVDGLKIAYERVGSGPPLVLVHGAGEDGRIWQAQVDELADAFTVVTWDEPGAGRSADVPDDFSLRGYADALAAVVEDVALGPAHVAGLSWGGTVALELYRAHPGRVSSLVLIDTYAGWRGSLPAEEVEARVEGLREMLAVPFRDFDPTLPGLFAGEPPEAAALLLSAIAADVRPATLRRQLEIMAVTDLTSLLPQIAVPTLLLWGELDVRSPLRVAHEFAAAIPGAELVVVPGAGHMSPIERPDVVNEAVRSFCLAHATPTS